MSSSSVLVVGRYRLVNPLGAGGMGRVWHAWDETLGRDVAVKEIVPPQELLARERDEIRRRTLREARAAARLSHPNVVRVYDVFETENRPWIVMEYVPSRSLEQVIAADGPLAPVHAATIGLGVLAALRAAHRAGVLHRDVKPSNVLLGDDGRVVLTDFGIATVEGDATVTRPGLVLGSPAYISPERARDGSAGPESDLWSLGATLHAAVEGRSPFERSSALATLTALASEELQPAPRAGPLRPVLNGLLRKDPAARIDAAEAERRLRRAAGAGGGRRLRWRWGDGGGMGVRRGTAESATAEPATARFGADAPADAEPAAAPEPEPVAATVLGTSPGSGSTAARPPRVRGSARVTPADPSTESGTERARRQRSVRVAVVLSVVVLLTGAWLVAGILSADSSGGRGRAADAPGPTSSPSAPGAESTGAAASPAPTGSVAVPTPPPAAIQPERPPLPPGWIEHRDPTGFSVYVPAGWRVSREKTLVYFRGNGRVLGIDQTDNPRPDPVADWRGQASARVRAGHFPNYREMHIKAVPFWQTAADWEFSYDTAGGRVHINNRGFVVSPRKAYGIWWQTPETQWNAALPDLQLVFASFRPAPGV